MLKYRNPEVPFLVDGFGFMHSIFYVHRQLAKETIEDENSQYAQ